LTVKEASFNVTLFHVRADFWHMERNIRWIDRDRSRRESPKAYLVEDEKCVVRGLNLLKISPSHLPGSLGFPDNPFPKPVKTIDLQALGLGGLLCG